MKRFIPLFAAVLVLFSCSSKQQQSLNEAATEAKIDTLLSKMTLEEKVNYINGTDNFYIRPMERLGLPAVKMTDGPVGTRGHGDAVSYPASVLSAASWDTALVYKLGEAIARDCKVRGIDILLAPGVNIARNPLTGRNFEYLGEDPYLSSRMAANYIRGVQDNGVVATIKHFTCNNLEYDRNWTSSEVDERTLHEIYLPAFKYAVENAGVSAVMNSYNPLNGIHTSHNSHLNNDILKGKWGFKGILMSDWGSVHNGVAAVLGGTDLEMPGNQHMVPDTLIPAIERGEITEEMIDAKIRRIMRVCYQYGFYDKKELTGDTIKTNEENATIALELARAGIVLLKNDSGILPLNLAKTKRIAVIGPNADNYAAGGGSSFVRPADPVTLLEGLKNMAPDADIRYNAGLKNFNALARSSVFYANPGSSEKGLIAEYFNNKSLNGSPVAARTEQVVNNDWAQAPGVKGIGEDNFSVRWTGVIRPEKTGTYKFVVRGDDGYRLWVNNKKIIDNWSDHATEQRNSVLSLTQGKDYSIKLEYYENGGSAVIDLAWYMPENENEDDEVIRIASEAEVAIVCVGFNTHTESEGHDRTFALPQKQERLLNLVAEHNPNTIVVLNSGGNVDMQAWYPKVKGLIHAFYPGQEGGIALAEILTGETNPSGKLPVSFEKKWEDNPTSATFFDGKKNKKVDYTEGIFVGYRYYDAKDVEPRFPFGFGLSYTTFNYSNLKVQKSQNGSDMAVTLTFDVTNTGPVDGAEVAQVYVADKDCRVERPVKELKGFSKVFLKKGETKTVTVKLDQSAFSYYKIDQHDFGYDPGAFEVLVGSSSRDIRLSSAVDID
ncbi:glycoside hydrolase family 3 C-terminal domain-containing protein [Saccharicrinis sp. FJH54]|uniref:glycoside hydrolase family 3 C-terminal domain-containing protein n=1 Tax=Saccharicrinis sp. FJH54 TaxID=3344665 RepID=UPI0035D49889